MADNILVIFGAGASYDVVDLNNPYPATISRPEARPPLTNKIFTEEGFAGELLPSFPSLQGLATTIRFRAQKLGLETVLRQLNDSKQQNRKSEMLALPIYLNRLFYECSKFASEPVNYTELIGDLVERYDRIGFVTLNYDLLLDWALTKQEHWGPPFLDLSSYVRDRWLLVKLHGSVNWGRRVIDLQIDDKSVRAQRNLMLENYIELFSTWPLQGRIAETIELLPNRNDFFASPQEVFYPALSIPVDGKYEYNCPPEHVDALEAFMPSCSTVLAIGCSGKDRDLMDLLAANLATVDHFYCVSWFNDLEKEPPEQLFTNVGQLASAAVRVHKGGFTAFLDDGGIQGLEETHRD